MNQIDEKVANATARLKAIDLEVEQLAQRYPGLVAAHISVQVEKLKQQLIQLETGT